MPRGRGGPRRPRRRAKESSSTRALDLWRRGLAALNAGDREAALAGFDRAIEVDPRCGPAWNSRALARLDQADALVDLARAIELAPRDPIPRANRGQRRFFAGDLAGAREDLDRALALDPDDAWSLRWRAEVRLATGDRAGALADLERAVAVARSADRPRLVERLDLMRADG